MKSLIVIPARYGSSRFPGKPLAELAGKNILQRVWDIAASVAASRPDCSAVVATENPIAPGEGSAKIIEFCEDSETSNLNFLMIYIKGSIFDEDYEVLKKFDIDKEYNAIELFNKVESIFNTKNSVSEICFNCIWHDKCLFYQKLD